MGERTTSRHDVATRVVQHAPLVALVAVLVALLVRVRELYYIAYAQPLGYAPWVAQTTVDGTAIAPNQYRPLMPWVEHLTAASTGLPLAHAMLAWDLVLAVVAALVLRRLADQLGQPGLLAAAAGLLAFWAIRLAHWHPEVMLLTVLVAAAALLLEQDRPRPWALLVIAAVMCGARTDYAATLGLAVAAAGAHRRDRALLGAGLGAVVVAVLATVGLVHLYPQARYLADLVQLGYNLTAPNTWAIIASMYVPVVALAALAWRADRALPPLWPLWLWFVLQWTATLVVGRVDETRLFLPFAPALGIAAALSWQRLRSRTSA